MIKSTKLFMSTLLTLCLVTSITTTTFAATAEDNTNANIVVHEEVGFDNSEIYNNIYNSENAVPLTAAEIRAIENETYHDYFSSVVWLNRDGEISLSIRPTSLLTSNPSNNNPNVLGARASRSFELLKNKFSSSSNWRNTNAMRAQYLCHVQWAGGYKVPWNIEPHRTETNYLIVVAKACNP